jgi:hypothetical protein
MGEKKQKEKAVAQWKKIVVVGACVLFVVLMIVSGMGSSWISAFSVVKPGDVAVIDYTLYDAAGNSILTTNSQARAMLLTKQISLTANQSLTHSIYPVQVYSSSSGSAIQFALFRPEYDAMSSGILGMKVNEKKRIILSPNASMTQFWSPELLKRNGVNLSEIRVGDVLTMGVSDNPEEMVTNTSTMTYMRVGEVSNKSAQGVVVDFGYPTADVSIVSINNKN